MKKFLNRHAWKCSAALAGILCLALFCGIFLRFFAPKTTDGMENDEKGVVVQSSHGLLAYKPLEDLIQESNLVAVCTLKEVSQPFQIQAVGGGISNYTDYYFEALTVCRGEAPDGGIVPVRMAGGTVGNLKVEDDGSYDFETGKQYLLFLHSPGMGGGFNTQGDYYYLTGGRQGIYPYDEGINALSEEAQAATLVNAFDSASVKVSDLSAQVAEINESDPPKDDAAYQICLENQKENLENGFITQEEYDNFFAEAQQYAVIITEEPHYSGDK